MLLSDKKLCAILLSTHTQKLCLIKQLLDGVEKIPFTTIIPTAASTAASTLAPTAATAPTGSDTGIFNCTNIGRPDGGIPVTTSPGGSTAVPEPFTIIGSIVGGIVAFRMRKKLKAISS